MIHTNQLFVLLISYFAIARASQNQWLPGRRPPSGAPAGTTGTVPDPRPVKRLKAAEEEGAAASAPSGSFTVSNALNGEDYKIDPSMNCNTAHDIKHTLATHYGLPEAEQELFGTLRNVKEAEMTKLPSDAKVTDYHTITLMRQQRQANPWAGPALTFNATHKHPHLELSRTCRTLTAGGTGTLDKPPAVGETVMIVAEGYSNDGNGAEGNTDDGAEGNSDDGGEYWRFESKAVRVEGGYDIGNYDPKFPELYRRTIVNDTEELWGKASSVEGFGGAKPLTEEMIEREEKRTVVVGDFFSLSDYPDKTVEDAAGGSNDAPKMPDGPSVSFYIDSTDRAKDRTRPSVYRSEGSCQVSEDTIDEGSKFMTHWDPFWADEGEGPCWYEDAEDRWWQAYVTPHSYVAARADKWRAKCESNYAPFIWTRDILKKLGGKANVELEEAPVDIDWDGDVQVGGFGYGGMLLNFEGEVRIDFFGKKVDENDWMSLSAFTAGDPSDSEYEREEKIRAWSNAVTRCEDNLVPGVPEEIANLWTWDGVDPGCRGVNDYVEDGWAWAVKSVEDIAKALHISLPPRGYGKDEEREEDEKDPQEKEATPSPTRADVSAGAGAGGQTLLFPDQSDADFVDDEDVAKETRAYEDALGASWLSYQQQHAKECTTVQNVQVGSDVKVVNEVVLESVRIPKGTVGTVQKGPDEDGDYNVTFRDNLTTDQDLWFETSDLGTVTWQDKVDEVQKHPENNPTARMGAWSRKDGIMDLSYSIPDSTKPSSPWKEGAPTEVNNWVWTDFSTVDDEDCGSWYDEDSDHEANLPTRWDWLTTCIGILAESTGVELEPMPESDVESEADDREETEESTSHDYEDPDCVNRDPKYGSCGRDWEEEPHPDHVWFGLVPEGYDCATQPSQEVLDVSCSLRDLSDMKRQLGPYVASLFANPWFAVGDIRKGIVKVEILGRKVRYSIRGKEYDSSKEYIGDVIAIEKNIPDGWERVALAVTMRQTRPGVPAASVTPTGGTFPGTPTNRSDHCRSLDFHICPSKSCWGSHGGNTEEQNTCAFVQERGYATAQVSVTIV